MSLISSTLSHPNFSSSEMSTFERRVDSEFFVLYSALAIKEVEEEEEEEEEVGGTTGLNSTVFIALLTATSKAARNEEGLLNEPKSGNETIIDFEEKGNERSEMRQIEQRRVTRDRYVHRLKYLGVMPSHNTG